MKKNPRLLLIDDCEETVVVLQWFFGEKYEIFTALDGLEALKLFEEKKGDFDLVITDLVMPNISGVGVINIIRKKYSGVPIIALTGWGEHPVTLAVEARADIVVEKPIEPSELDRLVQELLKQKSDSHFRKVFQ